MEQAMLFGLKTQNTETKKKLYIRQPAGLGDILFLQKAALHMVDQGFTIVWPVISQYEYITEYIQHPDISFVSFNSLTDWEKGLFKTDIIVDRENYSYIPIDKLCHAMGNCSRVMESKYEYFQLNFNDWKNYLKIKRHHEREQKCREFFNLEKDEPFIFVNRLFASPPDIITIDFPIKTKYKIIENKQENKDKFRIFDFSWILENAKEIHTVETSFCYIIESLNTTGKLTLYSRKINGSNQFSNFNYIKNIYKKDWTYVL